MSRLQKTLVLENVKYEVEGSLGAVLRSFEKNVTQGEVRCINGTLLYAYMIGRRIFRKDVICWALVSSPNNYDDVRSFVNSL